MALVSKKAVILGAAAGAAVALGAVALVRAQSPGGGGPPPNQLASLTLAGSPVSLLQGGAVNFTGSAFDKNGAPLAGITVQVIVNGTSVGVATTDASGSLSFPITFNAAGSYQVSIQSGSIQSTVITISVSAPPPQTLTRLVLQGPTSSPPGSVPFTVSAFDQNGLPMPNVSGQLLLGGTPLAGSNFVTGPNGTASMTVSFTSPGSYTLVAVSGSVQSAPVSISISTATGPPVFTSIQLVPSTTATAVNTPVSFTITTFDQFGNPIAGVSGQMTEGGTPVAGSAWTTGAGGQTVILLTFPNPGSYAIAAVSGSISSNPVTLSITQPVATPPVTLATTVNVGATKADCNHKLFIANGLYWLFYVQDSNIVYITSSDKVNWSAPTTISSPGQGPGEMFDVFYDIPSGVVYFAWALSTRYFTFGVAKPTGAGNLAWLTPLTNVTVPAATGTYGVNRPTIRPDALGNIFVAHEASVSVTGGNSVHVMVQRFAGGTWAPIFDYDTAQGSMDFMGSIHKFTNGKMCLYYGSVNGGNIAFIQDWSGTAWGPQIVMTSGDRLEVMNGGGLTIGDTLYWGGFDTDSTGYVGFFRHTFGDTSTPVQVQLSDPATANGYISDGQGCISSDGANTLVVFYSGTIGFGVGAGRFTIYYRISNNLGGSWGPETIFAQNETGIQGKTLQCTDLAPTGEVQVAWTTNPDPGPYSVRFATLVI